jgi:hypothetical protein
METPILITLIICGTILLITILALLFAMWVINKGIAMSEKK